MAVTKDLIQQNIQSMMLWVLKDNSSCRFYEKMGGEVITSIAVDFAGKELTELAFGWKNISPIGMNPNHCSV